MASENENRSVKEDGCSYNDNGMLSLPRLLPPPPPPLFFLDPVIGMHPRGIILRTSSAFSGRYGFFPLHCDDFFSSGLEEFDGMYANSLSSAPHYPDITILDSISTNILYQTCSNSFQNNIFHVYSFIHRSHHPINFPYNHDFVNATFVIHDRIHFKLLVVCIEEEHPIPLFAKSVANKSLVFYVYSSKSSSWLRLPSPSTPLTSDHLLRNRKKPIHLSEGVACLDLTDRFLIRFDSLEGPINLIRKFVCYWEKDSLKLDEAARYDDAKGSLHCVKFNSIKRRFEIYVWMLEGSKQVWRLVVRGKVGPLAGKVLGICSSNHNLVLMRFYDKDEIFVVDIKQGIRNIVMGEWGPHCCQFCMNAAMSMGSKLQNSSCGVLHPHENIDGPEGEVFHISQSGVEIWTFFP